MSDNPVCPRCHLPESEHSYDRAAFGCQYYAVTEGHPHQPVGLKSNIFLNPTIILGVMVVAVCSVGALFLLISSFIDFLEALIP